MNRREPLKTPATKVREFTVSQYLNLALMTFFGVLFVLLAYPMAHELIVTFQQAADMLTGTRSLQ